MAGKSKRGFAAMDRARQREIAAKGGRAAHAKGTAHVWSPEEAREAGRKGGEIVSQDRAHMSAIGREGGESRSAAVRAARLRRSRDLAAVKGTPATSSATATARPVHDREVPIMSNGSVSTPSGDRLPNGAPSTPRTERSPAREANRTPMRSLEL